MWSVSTNRHSADHPFHFDDLLRVQSETLNSIRENGGSALLFAEMASVITVGRRQLQDDVERSRLESLGIAIVSGERGGNETWHGPGQWVGFVLTPLTTFTGDSLGVRKAVHKILDHTLSVARRYLPEAHLREGADLGIWSKRGKLVSVGIKINQGYITSGFAMNCIPNPQAFAGINPCGLEGALPDFLLRNLDADERENVFAQLPEEIASAFEKN